MDHHQFCDLFPDMPQEQLNELADDIRANGQHTPIYRWNGKILDGKNRFAACKLAGVKPNIEEWRPSDPHNEEQSKAEALAFVLSTNLHRRQLTESQRAMIAARLAKLRLGDNQYTEKEGVSAPTPSQENAAKQLDVSRDSVSKAKKVIETGSEKLVEAVESGDVSVRDAAKVARLPKKDQDKAVKAVKAGKAKTVSQAAGIDPEQARNDAIRDAHKPIGTPSGGDGFNPMEFDPEVNPELPPTKVDTKKPIAERIKEQQSIIELYARSVAKFVKDNRPTDVWLDEATLNIAQQQIDSALGTLRQAKAHDKPCRKCNGKGCDACRQCGYMPRHRWESIGS